MTASSDRLDRIEALIESTNLTIDRISERSDRTSEQIDRLSERVDRTSEHVDSLVTEGQRQSDRLDNYEEGMRWVVQLSFGLLISATVALIVSALTLLVKTVVIQ
jgi:methyl-accepting chemotaxis protein